MLGNISILISFGGALLSVVLYIVIGRKEERSLISARIAYYIFAGFIAIAVGYLFYLFLSNRFEYRYVYAYSSTDLPLFFKISALWGGQEGTFLLWLFIAALLGFWVMYKSGKDEILVMPIYILTQFVLYLLLFVKNPFTLNSVIPPDGRGLNPLLQNFWMVIHPPIVFIGYAALSIPFVYSIVALIKNKYDSWVGKTMPWVALSTMALGLGIFLGAYWAYETLGWGGFWGWDPVENSSLVPWLFSAALLHGMVVEKAQGALRKTNLFLASTAYVMVLYGTFLTRSGVLADFSVHSFVDLGLNNYLLGSLGFFVIFSWGFLLFRSRKIDSAPISKSYFSRDFFVYLTLLFLTLSGVIILLGTSAPIITGILGKAAAIRSRYYITTHIPLGILMTVAMMLFPFSIWKFKRGSYLNKRIIAIIASAVVSTIIGIIYRMEFMHLFLLVSSVAAAMANGILFFERLKGDIGLTAGMTAHIGVALLIIGSISSTGYSDSNNLVVTSKGGDYAFGRDFSLRGVEHIKRNKDKINLAVAEKGKDFIAELDFTDSEAGMVRTPYIKKYPFYDLYISPSQLDIPNKQVHLSFKKGEVKEVGNYRIEFIDFNAKMNAKDGGMNSVAAELILSYDDTSYTIFPKIERHSDGFHSVPAHTDFGGVIHITGLQADNGEIALAFEGFNTLDEEGQTTLYFQVSKKPLINFVWFGAILIVVGTLLSFRRRSISLTSKE